MRLSVSILSLLVLCYVSGITESAAIQEITPRFSFCKGVFGVNACADVNFTNGQLYLKFTVGGITIVDTVIDPSASREFCGGALGVKVCLQVNPSGGDLCFGIKGSAPFLGSTSFNLGCISLSDFIGK